MATTILRNDPCPCGSGRRYKACHGALRPAPAAETATPGTLLERAQAAHQRGELHAAEQLYREVLARDPAEAVALHFLGVIHWQRGNFAEAEAPMRQSVAARPDLPPFRNNLGLLLRDLHRNREAIEAFEAAIAIDAGYLEARTNLGDTLLRNGEAEAAVAHLERAGADPAAPVETFYTLALAYERAGRFADSLSAHRRAAERLPADVRRLGADLRGWSEAKCAIEERRFAGAPETAGESGARADLGRLMRAAREKLASHPFFAKVAFRAGQSALLVGELDEGWEGYQWRKPRLAFERRARRGGTFESPRLPRTIEGAVIAIEQEQGLGDTLFFLRYAAALRERGARVVFRGDPRLLPLLERAALFDACVGIDAASPWTEDFILTAGDLPLAAPAKGYPAPIALAALPDRMEKARAALAPLARPLALTWRAGTRTDDPYGVLFKSLDPAALGRSLASSARSLVSIQRLPDPGETEALAAAAGREVRDFSTWNDDLEDALALMAVLDEYAGVSNTNTHLRTGAGRTAKVLVPFPPEWRWQGTGDASPWFPGSAVFRQARDGSWEGALRSLAARLG